MPRAASATTEIQVKQHIQPIGNKKYEGGIVKKRDFYWRDRKKYKLETGKRKQERASVKTSCHSRKKRIAKRLKCVA
jgi:hypothetical protein